MKTPHIDKLFAVCLKTMAVAKTRERRIVAIMSSITDVPEFLRTKEEDVVLLHLRDGAPIIAQIRKDLSQCMTYLNHARNATDASSETMHLNSANAHMAAARIHARQANTHIGGIA